MSEWTAEREALVRRTVCPAAITDDEFALFMEQCKRSGLDPLLKEAFCVPRRKNEGSREQPNWVTRHEFQPSETGMLARAERFPDFRGVQASAACAGDELMVDQGQGTVVHRFNPAQRKGVVLGAWARLVREGRLSLVVWLDFEGYAQTTPLWSKMPATMMEKCARVAVLRKAYPEAFGGLYIREEMPSEESPEEAPKKRAKKEEPPVPSPALAEPPAPPGNVVPMRHAKPAASLAEMEDSKLDGAIREMEAWLGKYERHPKRADGLARLQVLRDELWRREIARKGLREPGAEV